MQRKNILKKISCITFSGLLAVAQPTAPAGHKAASAQDAGVPGTEGVTAVSSGSEAPATEPQAPATEPQTQAQTQTPATETQTQTQAPTTEPQTQTQTQIPATEPQTQVQTQIPATEPQTQIPSTEPQTQIPTEQTGSLPGTESESASSQTSELPSETGGIAVGMETEPEYVIIGETEPASITQFPSFLVVGDHSLRNENWQINVIASNAAYLGQLSNTYGISIADDFRGVCSQVEQDFAAALADPENFHASNWKDVFAVFLYESRHRNGSGDISAASAPLLSEVFAQMNVPAQIPADNTETVDMAEVFVEEYPIGEQLEQIDRQEELLLSDGTSLGSMGAFKEEYIIGMADARREAARDEQKEQMDRARYDKWLRQKQQQEQQTEPDLRAASITPLTIDDYVQIYGIDAEGKEEIEKYASAECLQLCAIASAEPQIVRASVGSELSEERLRIVTAAYSLVGKVGYFWGGKSTVIGWDNRWGAPAKVTASGSASSGMTRGFGLDCSGFVMYCYYNGLGGSDAGIGGHTTTQWNASVMVDQVNAQPGDLVFYGGPERGDMNHVGVVVGKSADGGLIVAHCSSSMNGVVVGEAWSSGFRYVRTVAALP